MSMNKKYFDELLEIFLECKSKKELSHFLFGLLTENELTEIPVRIQIIKMLKRGVTQREISQKLGVGVATITRGAKELHKGRFENI